MIKHDFAIPLLVLLGLCFFFSGTRVQACGREKADATVANTLDAEILVRVQNRMEKTKQLRNRASPVGPISPSVPASSAASVLGHK